MRILFIFPHPDDESFGPGPAIHALRQAGHEVMLLTLTRGGATSIRHELGLSVEEMGDVRYQEMLAMADVLGLSRLIVLDLPDSGLKDMDPREIEGVVARHIRQLEPQIVVTYPVHGISGFADHLVTHAVVKRVFLELRDNGMECLKRLAFTTIRPPNEQTGKHHLTGSKEADIDCVMSVGQADIEAGLAALDCYQTYAPMIEATGIRQHLRKRDICFEIFGESHQPPLTTLDG